MVVFKKRDSVPSTIYSSVCVNGESGSSLLIESTDSMIESTDSMIYNIHIYMHLLSIIIIVINLTRIKC